MSTHTNPDLVKVDVSGSKNWPVSIRPTKGNEQLTFAWDTFIYIDPALSSRGGRGVNPATPEIEIATYSPGGEFTFADIFDFMALDADKRDPSVKNFDKLIVTLPQVRSFAKDNTPWILGSDRKVIFLVKFGAEYFIVCVSQSAQSAHQIGIVYLPYHDTTVWKARHNLCIVVPKSGTE